MPWHFTHKIIVKPGKSDFNVDLCSQTLACLSYIQIPTITLPHSYSASFSSQRSIFNKISSHPSEQTSMCSQKIHGKGRQLSTSFHLFCSEGKEKIIYVQSPLNGNAWRNHGFCKPYGTNYKSSKRNFSFCKDKYQLCEQKYTHFDGRSSLNRPIWLRACLFINTHAGTTSEPDEH